MRDRMFPSVRSPVLLSAVALLLLEVPCSYAKPKPAPAAKAEAFLPTDFGGFHLAAPEQQSTEPQVADAANADVLKEYGFQQFASGSYTTTDNKLTVRAIRFADASGAYGAFTYYRRPGSKQEQIGRGAAWDGSHVLFWAGATVVDATFDRLTAMSAAELRELAGDLPMPGGSAGIAPSLPAYLPREDLVPGLTRYALGSASYSRSGGVLPSTLVGFGDAGAEALTATYSTRDGQGALTVINYPTPQIAADRMRQIDAFLKAGNTPGNPWPQSLVGSTPVSLLTRRSGPLVAVTTGALPANDARRLLNQINYQADVTWNKPEGYVSESSKVARLLLGIFALVGIAGGAAILLGLFLGGGRALVRVMRGKPASSLEEAEFIRLNLRD